MRKLRRGIAARISGFIEDWSLPRQLAGEDVMSKAAESTASRTLRPRLEEADTVGTSICPFCAVGCGQLVYAKNGKPIHIEGDPRSPVNQGTLCPKGASTLGVLLSPQRINKVLYRAPYATDWEEKPLDWAMERIAQLTKQTRDDTLRRTPAGRPHRQPHPGHRLARRRHAGQRGKLPHQEAVRRRPRHGQHREPGAHLTLLLGAQFGHLLRTRRRHHVPVGPGTVGLHRRDGLQHGGEPSDRVPLRGGGATAGRDRHPCRSALHPHLGARRHPRADPLRAPTSRSSAASSATSWKTICGSATSRWPTPTSPTSSRTATRTRSRTTACSPASTPRPEVLQAGHAGSTRARPCPPRSPSIGCRRRNNRPAAISKA